MRKRFARLEAFEEETKKKLKDDAVTRLDKCVQDSLHEREIINLETNEIIRCVYEVLMSSHERCSGLILELIA